MRKTDVPEQQVPQLEKSSTASDAMSVAPPQLERQQSNASEGDSVYEYEDSDEDDEEDGGGVVQEDSSPAQAQSNPSSSSSSSSALTPLDYRCVSPKQVWSEFKSEASKIESMCSIGQAPAMILLRECKYSCEDAVQAFFRRTEKDENECEKSKYRSSTLVYGEDSDVLHMCYVCCDDEVKGSDLISVGCNHAYCRTCWNVYLETKISQDGEVFSLNCMDPDCGIAISDSCVQAIAISDVYDKYVSFMTSKVTSENAHKFIFCPHPNCGSITEKFPSFKAKPKGSKITCGGCQNTFCKDCGGDWHLPASCHDARKWDKLSTDDGMTSTWIVTNTKECAKCFAVIEKNGGCSHMTCKKCRYEFCWLCNRAWSNHSQCNRLVEQENTSEARAKLQKYEHYWNRFNTHKKGAELEKNMLKATEKSALKADEANGGKSIALASEYLGKAVRTVMACRRALSWTYVHAYFMEDKNDRELFEFQQGALETAVENLSYQLENNSADGAQIVNLAAVAVTMASRVLEAGEEGVSMF
jgi:ariadne-1